MEYDFILQIIAVYQSLKAYLLGIACHIRFIHSTHNMEDDVTLYLARLLVIGTQTSYQSVEAVPIMHLCHTDQVKGIG